MSGQSTRTRGRLPAVAERKRMRAAGNTRKVMTIAFVVVISICSLYSTITVNKKFYDLTSEQSLGDKVDKLGAKNSTSNVPLQVGSEALINMENIPPFMKDYFDWHRKQLQQMKEDAELSNTHGNSNGENDDYLRNYRFLVLRCASTKSNGEVVKDRCGGLSDRLKAFPLFIWYAAKTNRILFIRWGNNRPAPIQTFLSPGNFWNWTFPDVLLRKIEELEESDNSDESFSRVYRDGTNREHKQLLAKIQDSGIWMVEGNDYTGGAQRYESFVNTAINERQENGAGQSSSGMIAMLRPEDAVYQNFYHDVFHATFRPSPGVQKLLDAYFYVPEEDVALQSRSWLPVPLRQNHYAMAQYRATYPGEPYKATGNKTTLRNTSHHAVECAKSRVASAKEVSNIYVTSDTGKFLYVFSDIFICDMNYLAFCLVWFNLNSFAFLKMLLIALVVEAVQDLYRDDNARASEGDTGSTTSVKVWTNLDLISYDMDATGVDEDGTATKTKPTIALAEDPPHLNFAKPDDVSAFYIVFVDLFLMSYANCVVYGAGGFGRLGSLVSYRPFCGTAFSVDRGKLKDCVPFD